MSSRRNLKLNLKPGNVYFLRMVDPSGRYEFPYVKVGITEGAVARRIDQIQTGNPFKIVAWNSFYSEAASLIERYIHHTFADRRVHLEWLKFEEKELSELLDTAKNYSTKISAKAKAVRMLDIRPSNGMEIEADDEIRALHGEIVTLLGSESEAKMRLEILELKLKSMTGTTGGIEGVTEATVIPAGQSFSTSKFKMAEPDLYTKYCFKDLVCSFSFLGNQQSNEFPELQDALVEAKSAVLHVTVEDVTSEMLSRGDEIESLHIEYLNIKSKLAEIRGELVLYELELRYACGENEGIAGVCSYKREFRKKFDKNAFKKDYPNLWEKFQIIRSNRRRFRVLPSRDYV